MTIDLEARAVLFAGPAAAAEAEVAGLLVAASAGVVAITSTAFEVLAVLGVLVWVVALLGLVIADVSRARRRAHSHQPQHNRSSSGASRITPGGDDDDRA